jgi:hypothetical protein
MSRADTLHVETLVVLTNAARDEEEFVRRGMRLVSRPPTASIVFLHGDRLGELLDAGPAVRRRVPTVLGVRDLDPLLDGAGSSWDEAAARELARVFVPTRAYRRTLETLERHRFAVLTGPPEMGKTAIARTLGLALATERWQVHECIRPEQVWEAFDEGRPQLFVADDAFGSTEYRPDAAERWALDLDRILRRLDDRHWLVWTSRPAPLKAGLGRVHREHGVERFPQPAQVHVDASSLDVEEKTLILFRHARACGLRPAAVDVVRRYGLTIVEHPHFTPGRIGRFVQLRLPQLAAGDPEASLRIAIGAEIAEPTRAMAESYRALSPEHRALLVALIDQPPGPVGERELFATARRHAPEGLSRAPLERLDRLTDHFVRVLPPASVTWVHPSWRDLVIEELADDASARRGFLERCSVDGLLLALSDAGGRVGERSLPLLVDDADWDAAAERIHELVPELADPDLLRLLTSLESAIARADARSAAELLALASTALERLGGCWRSTRTLPGADVIARWLDLAARLPEPPSSLDTPRLWELAVPPAVTPYTIAEAEGYLRWLRFAATLQAHAPEQLERLRFPDAYLAQLHALVVVALHDEVTEASGTLRRTMGEALDLLTALCPEFRARAYYAAARLRMLGREQEPAPESEVVVRSPEPAPQRWALVDRILADLG